MAALDLSHIHESLRPLATPIADLHPDPHNARRHSPRNLKALAASLQAFGQQKPIVADPGGTVLAGNGTLEAARSLNWTYLAVVRSTLTGPAARAFALADNRTAELAEWDHPALVAELATLARDPGIDATLTAFNRDDIAQALDEHAANSEPFEIPRIFQVIAQCPGESDQRRAYELLTRAGFDCRVLTL
jgi:ParB-like chromosome segregation protein Spo0J